MFSSKAVEANSSFFHLDLENEVLYFMPWVIFFYIIKYSLIKVISSDYKHQNQSINNQVQNGNVIKPTISERLAPTVYAFILKRRLIVTIMGILFHVVEWHVSLEHEMLKSTNKLQSYRQF